MSGVAEKARFYLERSVPQLREWEEREIFTKEELRTIVQKRSDFEHRVLAQGNTPADYSAYAHWEQSLDALRAKRCARLRLRNLTSAHASQARILQLYDRAVERHQFAKPLWLEYLDYMARVRASKRWRRVMTRVLRLMPRDGELWVIAARRAAGGGDMATARATFMRGCRFCTDDGTVWVGYARCEMEWLSKMEGKKDKASREGRDVVRSEQEEDGDEIRFGGSDDDEEDSEDEDGVISRDPDSLDVRPKKVFSSETKTKLKADNPALDGAIVLAIFDISRKQPFFSPAAAQDFFDTFAEFATTVGAGPKVLQHVVDVMREAYPASAETAFCYVRQPVAGVSPHTADFPRGLREVFARLRPAAEACGDGAGFRERMSAWVEGILRLEGLDPAIVTVLEHIKASAAS